MIRYIFKSPNQSVPTMISVPSVIMLINILCDIDSLELQPQRAEGDVL